MRRILLAAVAATAALSLAGCGGGQTGTGAEEAPPASTAETTPTLPGEETPALPGEEGSGGTSTLPGAGNAENDALDPMETTVPADQASAERVALHQADVGPGWVGGPTTGTTPSRKAPVCPQQRPDFSALTITGHAESVFDNGTGGIQIVSDVEVWKTPEEMQTHYGLFLQPKIAACIKYSLLKSVGGTNVTLLPVTRTRDFPKLAPVTAHFRAPIGIKSGGQTVTVLADFIYLGKGRTQIYLNVVAPQNVEGQLRALEVRVAKALVARIDA